MYHSATKHFVTDRRTDDSMMPLADHTACSTIVYLADLGRQFGAMQTAMLGSIKYS